MNSDLLRARVLRLLLLCGCVLCPGVMHAQSVSNPISDLADPHLTFANGAYYLTGTTGPTLSLRRAQTLNGLKSAPLIPVYSPAQGGPNQLGWAPELHFLDGKWYIYYSAFYGANDSDGNAPRIYVIENPSADPLSGTWTLKGYLKASPDYWAIDGTVLVLRGQKYLLWAGKDDPNSAHGAIYISKMSNPWTLTGGRTKISTPDSQWFAWEKAGDWVNEGPEVMLANGKVFLTYSASMFYTPDYCLGLFTLNDTEDPMNAAAWKKSSEPVFKKNNATAIYGPGHNSFFKSPDGKEVWMAYHSRSDLDNGPRTTSVKRIFFSSDGMPVFGVPPKNGESLPAPAGEPALPSASPLANGVYRLAPRSNTGSALEVAGGNRALGSRVQQWQWLDGDAQRWNVQAIGNGYYTLTAMAGGLALEIEGCSSSGGAKVRPWMANGAACQQWQIVATDSGFYRIINRQSGLVMDVAGGGTTNGTDIIQWGWQQGTAQQWRFDALGQTPVQDGVYALFNQASGQAMDIAGCSTANSARVEQFPWWGGDCQRFQVTATGDGAFRISPRSSPGKAMDLPGCSTANPERIEQYDWLNNDCQRWYINPVGNGFYNIVSKRSGLALDLPGCSNANPTLLQQYTWLNNACQKWRFEPVMANNGQ